MSSAHLLIELDRRADRRLRLHAIAGAMATCAVVLSALAVRYELSGAALDGGFGVLIRCLEAVFIVGVVPLTVTAVHSGCVVIGLMIGRNARRRRLPAAAIHSSH